MFCLSVLDRQNTVHLCLSKTDNNNKSECTCDCPRQTERGVPFCPSCTDMRMSSFLGVWVHFVCPRQTQEMVHSLSVLDRHESDEILGNSELVIWLVIRSTAHNLSVQDRHNEVWYLITISVCLGRTETVIKHQSSLCLSKTDTRVNALCPSRMDRLHAVFRCPK